MQHTKQSLGCNNILVKTVLVWHCTSNLYFIFNSHNLFSLLLLHESSIFSLVKLLARYYIVVYGSFTPSASWLESHFYFTG